jgi:hypothetical protein
MAAADIRGACPSLKLVHNAIERRQPLADQMHVVAGAEEALATMEQTLIVLAPFHALTSAEILKRALAHVEEILDKQIRTRQIDRPCRVGHAERLLRVQMVFINGGIVVDVAARGLIAEPLTNVALVGLGARGQIARRERFGRQRLVPSDNDNPWSCDSVHRLNGYMTQRARFGELVAARNAVELSGETVQALAQKRIQAIETLQREAQKRQQEETSESVP